MSPVNPTPRIYTKSLIPLESDPSVLSVLMHDLGTSHSLTLADVVSIDDPTQLRLIPRPALALILVLPTSEAYERHRRSAEKIVRGAEHPHAEERGEEVIWFRQTIDNACGLYAILHAVCNFDARAFIEPESLLSKLCTWSAAEREAWLNTSAKLEEVYNQAAQRGATSPPPAEEEVDLHYVCFVKSPGGAVYEMDGDAVGPVRTDIALRQGEDMLAEAALKCVRRCIARDGADDGKFSLLALVRNCDNSD